MIVKKKPMPLVQKVIYLLSFVFLIIAFIFLGTRNYKVKELPDNQLFNREYKNVSVDNSFQIFDSFEALTFLENGTGILFLGFPDNIWSASIAELLDTASKEANYSPIYYFDFLKERESKHDNYLGIVREIDEYLVSDDRGNVNLYAPIVVAVVKGDVVFFDDHTAFMKYQVTPKEYWSETRKREQIERYKVILERLKKEA